jgi:uncharacterized OsmC-like protein
MRVVIRDCGAGRFEVRTRDAVLAVDLLPGDGGMPDGFRSAELLLGALGACTAGTMRAFAVRQEIQGFEGIDIIVTGEVAKQPERVARLNLQVDIKGDISVADKERLLRVGSHCKVHNTLHSEPEIEMNLDDSSLVLE